MRASKLLRFQYDEAFAKWLWFVAETLVSAFVGALVALVFGSHYSAALIAFGTLMLFLGLLAAVLIAFDNRVSVLSIMTRGLRDGKYEDVIKFGSAMRATLFTANKNDDIVVLGAKIDAAAAKIESAHYNNSKGDYLVEVDGASRSITQIRIGLKIDDLGWSMHLAGQTGQAIANIINGMKAARHKALTLTRGDAPATEKLVPLVQMILRGYRHLAGIYYEDVEQHGKALFYENVTKVIMSRRGSVVPHTTCESGGVGPEGTTCGFFCGATFDQKVACSRKNILARYFGRDSLSDGALQSPSCEIADHPLSRKGGLLSMAEMEEDATLYWLLPTAARDQIVREQCYAWSRNIVKRVQNGMHRQGGSAFLSDVEFSSRLAEARAFSQIYYYGAGQIPTDDDFARVINQAVVGKSAIRYASLMSEIELVKLLLPASDDSLTDAAIGANIRVERLINNLRAAREICRDKRADLYVRASAHLMTAYHLEYNLNHRYLTDATDESRVTRERRLADVCTAIKGVYKDIVSYEHRKDPGLATRYRVIMSDLREARRALRKKYVVTDAVLVDEMANQLQSVDEAEYHAHAAAPRLKTATYVFAPEELERLNTKWSVK